MLALKYVGAEFLDKVSYFFQVDLCTRMCLLDFTLHYGEHRIVLPGDASWKRLCSLSVTPDDDDDMTVYKA